MPPFKADLRTRTVPFLHAWLSLVRCARSIMVDRVIALVCRHHTGGRTRRLNACIHAVVFFDMSAGGQPLGRIEMTVSSRLVGSCSRVPQVVAFDSMVLFSRRRYFNYTFPSL